MGTIELGPWKVEVCIDGDGCTLFCRATFSEGLFHREYRSSFRLPPRRRSSVAYLAEMNCSSARIKRKRIDQESTIPLTGSMDGSDFSEPPRKRCKLLLMSAPESNSSMALARTTPSASSNTLTLEDLPTEMLQHIFTFLTVKEIVRLSRVSKRLCVVAEDDTFFRSLFLARFGAPHSDFSSFRRNFNSVSSSHRNRVLSTSSTPLSPVSGEMLTWRERYMWIHEKRWRSLSRFPAFFRLLWAIQQEGGYLSIVRDLLPQISDSECLRPTAYGLTALHIAAQIGNRDVVDTLLERAAFRNAVHHAANCFGVTPLAVAVDAGHYDVAALLLAAGADPNALGYRGATPLFTAACIAHVDIARLLLASGADPNRGNDEGVSPLAVACGKGLLELARLLLSAGANADVADVDGVTPLMIAAYCGSVDVVDTLLAAGANPNRRSRIGEHALLAAAEGGHVDVVDRLLAAGADVSAADDIGQTALFKAAEGHTAVVVRLLGRPGVDVDKATRDRVTPLMVAAYRGWWAIVDWLVRAGADVDAANEEGETALLLAAIGGHAEVVRRLVDAGARVCTAAADGTTPLDAATHAGHKETVTVLREAAVKQGRREAENEENAV